MANKYLDTTLTDKAIIFAVNAHKNTERRGHKSPYILHVLEAAAIVETITKDQEIIAAAILHDTLEDTATTKDDLIKEFGPRVAELVASESETPVEGMSLEDSWKMRKQAAINRLKNASFDAKIVAMGDKLSNMRAIYRDYMEKGDAIWNVFHNNDPKMHKWHYEGLRDALSELSDTFAYKEFSALIDKVFENTK